jgi:hypothetical protein
MRATLFVLAAVLAAGLADPLFAEDAAPPAPRLRAVWESNFLTISGDHLPGSIRVNYLEAYCRSGSTDRDWGETVIKHQAELVSVSDDGRLIRLRDTLVDGVVVEHALTVRDDEIDFRLVAHNPTEKPSEAHWAQPCIRVDQFTGDAKEDARTLVPPYARKCFLFVDGKLARLPTEPWATEARYTPGQVYCPKHVPRDDVNPRPLSDLVPSSGLCGCFSADERWIMATAFEPYQEIFQGVITCIHNDFRIGGLARGEKKTIRGKIYIVPNDVDALLTRFHRDFPEQAPK